MWDGFEDWGFLNFLYVKGWIISDFSAFTVVNFHSFKSAEICIGRSVPPWLRVRWALFCIYVTLISVSVNRTFSFHKAVLRFEKINGYQFVVKWPEPLELPAAVQCLADWALWDFCHEFSNVWNGKATLGANFCLPLIHSGFNEGSTKAWKMWIW